MIRAIVTDVDGVIVGDKLGFNFPVPNKDVTEAMKHIRKSGLPMVLCTGKGLYPNIQVIKDSYLNNPHITDGGALISDPLEYKTIARYVIDKETVGKVINYSLTHDAYIEIYYDDSYAIQKNQKSEITKIHTDIMRQDPEIVDDLVTFAASKNVIKIICIVDEQALIDIIDPFFEKTKDRISHVWSIHPALLPRKVTIITKNGVSKKHAVEKVIKSLNVSFDEVLGIGDTPGDWKFMQLCKYAGVVSGEESKELENLVKGKSEGSYFIAKSVNENGILDIFRYFNLYK
jgi:HAD superfamily hydrolase (TIGR01484 family)